MFERRFKRFSHSYVKRKKKVISRLTGLFFAPWARIAAFALVRAEKEREADNGHDGAEVADPDLVRVEPRKRSTLFIGYCEAALGLGETFRNMLRALDQTGLAFFIYPFNGGVETRFIGPFLESRYDQNGVYDVNVIYVAADQLPYVLQPLNKQVSGAGYNILRTYWELPLASAEWEENLARFDELWVPNAFVADAFRPIFKGVITTVPVCVNVERRDRFGRGHFGLEDDVFYFVFSFDYYSGTARKNPLGVVQAFIYAFPDLGAKVGLVLKSIGPEELNWTTSRLLLNFAAIDCRITYMNRSMARDEMLSLLDVCDCYVSLHRSEGFGAGMAEAMALGKPVIGTDFSGNREFLNAETGFPAPCVMRPLIAGEYPKGEGQSWAEPDLEAAIDLMRRVVTNSRERERRAAIGQREIEQRYSAAAVAKAVEGRLEAVCEAKGFISERRRKG